MSYQEWLNRYLPAKWADRVDVYIRLMRAEKPIGTLLLLWPTYWALWIAAEGAPDFTVWVVFTLGTFLMRSAGCVANDFADRNFDGQVERTKNRPFAQGKVSGKEAAILIVILCLAALLCLLPLNGLTWLLSLPAVFLAMSYPFTKRFFPVPQFYLGLAFSFGIPMAFAAIRESVPLLAWVIFIANIFWTLAYDTIYAMADKEDDIKIGIRTSALTFGHHDIAAVVIFHALFDGFMALVGMMIEAGWPYWLALLAVIGLQIRQYAAIRGRDRWVCFATFLGNNRVGLVWFVGILVNYWAGY